MTRTVTREDFGQDWDDVLQRWAPGAPVNITPEHGWAALGALERLMPQRLAEYYELEATGNIEFSQLLALGLDLLACELLEHVDRILARILHGEHGAEVELEVLAFVVRSSLVPVIEPELQGKLLDFAVDTDQGRVFFEVIGPTWSDAAARLRDDLQAAAESLFPALRVGERLQVGFIEEPTEALVAEIYRRIDALTPSYGVQAIDDAALMRLDALDAAAEAIDLGPAPAIGVARFEFDGTSGRVVDVAAAFSDERVRRLIADELHHFSRNHPNVLVIQVGAVAGALPDWIPLIQRLFQPSRNTRIGAVILLERLFQGVVVPGAHTGSVLANPHAIRAVPRELLDALDRGLHAR